MTNGVGVAGGTGMSEIIDLRQQGSAHVRPMVQPIIVYRGKRAFDLVAGTLLAIAATPFILACAAALAIQHRANPFFVHHRIGLGGDLIAIPKLRTLCPRTPAYADKTEIDLVPPTRFASLLRRLHLDETPQLFLVPLGRLSLVGPRPRMMNEAEAHDDVDFGVIRTSVHQGCTGLWQVSVHAGDRVSDHTQYDEYYVSNRTMRLDLWILWRTALQAIGAKGIELADVPRWTLRPDAVIG